MPTPSEHRPAWKLLPGVTAGTNDYVYSDTIATDYDNYFSYAKLFQWDRELIHDFLPIRPGMIVADFGCGTGRSLLPLVERGATGWAIDLSQEMLQVVQAKADANALDIHCLRANLVQLESLADHCADAALCMFSTLGMIHGHDHRQRALSHMARILKPQGRFVLHVHNYWNQLTDPGGVRYVLSNLLGSLFGHSQQRGDRYYPYRGVPQMYLHTFTRRELTKLLAIAGLSPTTWHSLRPTQDGNLKHPRWLNWLRASGWIVLGTKTTI
jgi:ubiquinone/menaquinone biosynthesis C-methylase UbiE